MSKDEALSYAKSIAPKGMRIDVMDHNAGFTLVLGEPGRESMAWVHFGVYQGQKNEELDSKIKESTKKQIKDNILKRGIDEAEGIIDYHSLDDYFKSKYADKNILYKVDRWYDTTQSAVGSKQVNFGLYYQERVFDAIPNIKTALRVYLHDRDTKATSKDMAELLFSATWRFEQLFFAYDRIVNMSRSPNDDNDFLFVIRFHLYYFISLVKTLCDNIAWLISIHLGLTIDPYEVDLFFKSFARRINETRFSPILFDHPEFQNIVKIKAYRDLIEHRNALRVIHVAHVTDPSVRGRPPAKVMIPRDPQRFLKNENVGTSIEAKDLESLINYGLHQMVILFGNKDESDFESPNDFCVRHMNFLKDVLYKVLERIILENRRKEIGRVSNYLSNLGVSIIDLKSRIQQGDQVMIEGNATSFIQKVVSLQVDKQDVKSYNKGLVGMKVGSPTRKNDTVYLLGK